MCCMLSSLQVVVVHRPNGFHAHHAHTNLEERKHDGAPVLDQGPPDLWLRRAKARAELDYTRTHTHTRTHAHTHTDTRTFTHKHTHTQMHTHTHTHTHKHKQNKKHRRYARQLGRRVIKGRHVLEGRRTASSRRAGEWRVSVTHVHARLVFQVQGLVFQV